MRMDLTEQDLQYLTSPVTAGRLSGTRGAELTSVYLAESLKALGLKPGGREGFFQPVDVPAARLVGPARLVVGGAAYRHRQDFGEMAHLSAGGSVQAPLVVVRDGDEVRPEDIRGKVVLVPHRPDNFDFHATAAAVAEFGAAALMVEWGEPRWFHKTIFGSANNRIPVLRLRESIASTLAAQPGVIVDLDLPLEVGVLSCRNVLGLLPGTEARWTVALTAHYDHVGDDPGGQRFPGAIDNASGVVTMLAVLRSLVERSVNLPFNLLVGFLTGEESGMWGAKRLAAEPPLPLSAVINLDGMGYESALREIRLGYPGPGNWLAEMAADHYQRLGVTIRWIAGSDDSAAFQAAGLPGLGLGQMPTAPMPAQIHTPEDTFEVIHLPTIHEGAESIVSLIARLAAHPAMAV